MKNKRAFERLTSQGLTKHQAYYIMSWVATLNLPIEKLTTELSAQTILDTVTKIAEIINK